MSVCDGEAVVLEESRKRSSDRSSNALILLFDFIMSHRKARQETAVRQSSHSFATGSSTSGALYL